MFVEVNVDVADLVIAELKDSYRMTRTSIKELKARKKKLKDFEREDLENDKEVLKALGRVLQYYMVSSDFDDFVKGLGE